MAKNPKIMKHKGVTIYYDLNTGRFYAKDKLTGERWEDTSVWGVQHKIDEPLWEACEMEIYAVVNSLTFDMQKLHAKRINKRTNVPEFIVTETSKMGKYDVGKEGGDGKYGFAGYLPINEHNEKIFKKLVQVNAEIKEKEKEKISILHTAKREGEN